MAVRVVERERGEIPAQETETGFKDARQQLLAASHPREVSCQRSEGRPRRPVVGGYEIRRSRCTGTVASPWHTVARANYTPIRLRRREVSFGCKSGGARVAGERAMRARRVPITAPQLTYFRCAFHTLLGGVAMVSDNAATSAFGAASQPPARPHVNERQNSNERRDSVRLVLQPTRRNRTTCGPYPREQLDTAPVEKLAYGRYCTQRRRQRRGRRSLRSCEGAARGDVDPDHRRHRRHHRRDEVARRRGVSQAQLYLCSAARSIAS